MAILGGAEQICSCTELQAGQSLQDGWTGVSSGCSHRISNQEWLEQWGNYFPHRTRPPKARIWGLLLRLGCFRPPPSYPLEMDDGLMLWTHLLEKTRGRIWFWQFYPESPGSALNPRQASSAEVSSAKLSYQPLWLQGRPGNSIELGTALCP